MNYCDIGVVIPSIFIMQLYIKSVTDFFVIQAQLKKILIKSH